MEDETGPYLEPLGLTYTQYIAMMVLWEHKEIKASTVIFHRNNICRKFGTRSIGRLTIKAVLAGAVDVNEI